MLRSKFVHSELPVTLKNLASLLVSKQFSDETGAGFLLSSSTESKLIGQYVEKYNQVSIVVDPFGNETEVESIGYYTCKFGLEATSDYMMIIEPPRSLKKFTNALHELTGLGLVISEGNIDLSDWIKNIEELADSFTVKKVATSGIKSSDYSSAKLSITGSRDVRETLLAMLENKRHLVEYVTFEANFEGLQAKCELSRTGSCKLITQNSDQILLMLKKSLIKSHGGKL